MRFETVGFTGTQDGMTNAQLVEIHMLLGDLQSAGATNARHGMCVGADEQFHVQAKGFGLVVTGHPGVTKSGKVWKRSSVQCDGVVPERFFLIRNRHIVNLSDLMIATPKQVEEQMIGSGTWATIRYARKVKKPLVIVWPDGSSSVEHVVWALNAQEFRQLIAR